MSENLLLIEENIYAGDVEDPKTASTPNQSQEDRRLRAARMRADRDRQQRRRTRLIRAWLLITLAALVAGAAVAVDRKGDDRVAPPVPTSDTGATPTGVNAQFGVALDTGPTSEANPPHIVVYEDFLCEACKAFSNETSQYLSELASQGRATVEYRVVTFLDDLSQTKYSSRAANAAACTLDQGSTKNYLRMRKLLFETQPRVEATGLSNAELAELAEKAGTNAAEARRCIDDGQFTGWTARATDRWKSGTHHTVPAAIIDGDPIEGQPDAKTGQSPPPGIADLRNRIELE